MQDTLIYVHDPMCSWCWGFEKTRQDLFSALADNIGIRRLLGGLAPDSDVPMPESMQAMLQQTWSRIEQTIPGTIFNYSFWQKCHPRRSTYPANRAIIAARQQGDQYDEAMSQRIQKAYYLEARNPSDNSTLIDLARDLGLDEQQFKADLTSEKTEQVLINEIETARGMGINGFPSLALQRNGSLYHLRLDYNSAEVMLQQIEAITLRVS